MTRAWTSGQLAALWMLAAACGPDTRLPPRFRHLDVPETTLESAATRAEGRRLFDANCALCHGTRLDGHGARREGLALPPRDFTDRAWRRGTSPRRVFAAIREGVPRSSMPAWPALNEQDTWAVVAYVLSAAESPPPSR